MNLLDQQTTAWLFNHVIIWSTESTYDKCIYEVFLIFINVMFDVEPKREKYELHRN